MEKRIKYNDLVANAAALHTVVDVTHVLRALITVGNSVTADDVAELSLYITRTSKRFGDYAMPTGDAQNPLRGTPPQLACPRRSRQIGANRPMSYFYTYLGSPGQRCSFSRSRST